MQICYNLSVECCWNFHVYNIMNLKQVLVNIWNVRCNKLPYIDEPNYLSVTHIRVAFGHDVKQFSSKAADASYNTC